MIKDGDNVIVYIRKGDQKQIKVQKNDATNTCMGILSHENIIGLEYGAGMSLKKGVVYLLKPDISNKILTQKKVTQVLFEQDMGLIVHFLALREGCLVIECGTGSGLFTSVLSNAVGKKGHVFTYEIDRDRYTMFMEDIERYSYKNIQAFLRDVNADGFLQESVDSVFLDMADPYSAIEHAKRALVNGGRICVFLPSFRQVEKALEILNQSFSSIRMFENVMKIYSKSRSPEQKPKDVVTKMPQYAHTGYLLFGIK